MATICNATQSKDLSQGNPVHARKCYFVNNDIIIITNSRRANGATHIMHTMHIPDD